MPDQGCGCNASWLCNTVAQTEQVATIRRREDHAECYKDGKAKMIEAKKAAIAERKAAREAEKLRISQMSEEELKAEKEAKKAARAAVRKAQAEAKKAAKALQLQKSGS